MGAGACTLCPPAPSPPWSPAGRRWSPGRRRSGWQPCRSSRGTCVVVAANAALRLLLLLLLLLLFLLLLLLLLRWLLVAAAAAAAAAAVLYWCILDNAADAAKFLIFLTQQPAPFRPLPFGGVLDPLCHLLSPPLQGHLEEERGGIQAQRGVR